MAQLNGLNSTKEQLSWFGLDWTIQSQQLLEEPGETREPFFAVSLVFKTLIRRTIFRRSVQFVDISFHYRRLNKLCSLLLWFFSHFWLLDQVDWIFRWYFIFCDAIGSSSSSGNISLPFLMFCLGLLNNLFSHIFFPNNTRDFNGLYCS